VDPLHALIRLILLGAMVGLVVGGFITLLMIWYARGRDPQVGLVADMVPEPPDDLSAGAAGTLIDERVDHSDVVATLAGLGRNGAVEVTSENGDWRLKLVNASLAGSLVERDLIQALFAANAKPGDEVRLSEVRGSFQARQEQIRADLYAELVERGYFVGNPEQVRKRWKRIGIVGMILSMIVGVLLGIVVDPFAFGTMIAALIFWYGVMWVGRHMPRKTPEGAEAAAKWKAFRRHLTDLKKRTDFDNAQQMLDAWLPYAIAFGIEKKFLAQFQRQDVQSPGWFGDGGGGDVIILTDGFGGLPSGGSMSMPDVSMPEVSMPDVQGLSDTMSGALESSSDGLMSLFDSAGSIFDSIDIDIDF